MGLELPKITRKWCIPKRLTRFSELKINYERKFKAMINNFTNINKTNNHLLPELIEQAHTDFGVKPVNGTSTLPFW
jgi:hypothetical protein